MKNRQLPLLLLLAALCLGGVWLLTMDQEPAFLREMATVSSSTKSVKEVSELATPIVGMERKDVSPSSGRAGNSLENAKLHELTLQLLVVDETTIEGWQLAFVSMADGTVVEATSATDRTGTASFPPIAPGRYALEGALFGRAAFRMPLVIAGAKEMKIPMHLPSHSSIHFQSAVSRTPLPSVKCYLEGSNLLAAESNAGGIVTLRTQSAQLRFKKENYSDSYVFETVGQSEIVLMRQEIEVRLELAREWIESPGLAKGTIETVVEPITDFAAFYENPQPENLPFDYLRYRQEIDFGLDLMTSIRVPDGSTFQLRVQKGGAVVSLSTGELSAGRVILIPAPAPSNALELFLRNPDGALVKGELRAIDKSSGMALPVSWNNDHWVIAQPENCVRFEAAVNGCVEVWCWQKDEALNFGGFLELQLTKGQTFLGFLEEDSDSHFQPMQVSLSPGDYEKGISIHHGWISKSPGIYKQTLKRSGAFEMEGFPSQRFVVRVQAAAQEGGFGKVVGEVHLPNKSPFSIPQASMRHYAVRCIDKATGESIGEFAASKQKLGYSTESRMGLWQGWAETGDVIVFRAMGYQPLEVAMPEQSPEQLELEMQLCAPMALRISGLSDEEIASYSTMSLSLMRMMGDDLVTMSFTRDSAFGGRDLEAYFPADGEWVVISLRKQGDSGLGLQSQAFQWEPGGFAVVEF